MYDARSLLGHTASGVVVLSHDGPVHHRTVHAHLTHFGADRSRRSCYHFDYVFRRFIVYRLDVAESASVCRPEAASGSAVHTSVVTTEATCDLPIRCLERCDRCRLCQLVIRLPELSTDIQLSNRIKTIIFSTLRSSQP